MFFSPSFFSRIFFLFPFPNFDLPLKVRVTLTLAARIGFVLINLSCNVPAVLFFCRRRAKKSTWAFPPCSRVLLEMLIRYRAPLCSRRPLSIHLWKQAGDESFSWWLIRGRKVNIQRIIIRCVLMIPLPISAPSPSTPSGVAFRAGDDHCGSSILRGNECV